MLNERFESLISEHFPFIEKMCFKAVSKKLAGRPAITIENEALELSNLVLDDLKKDDFKVLRAYKGEAKLTSYLTVIIAHKTTELIRKKKGRTREKERAREYGELGELIYEMAFVNGYPLEKTYKILESENKIITTSDEVEQVYLKIRGTGKKSPPDIFPAGKKISGNQEDSVNNEELVVVDQSHNPENKFIADQLTEKQQLAVSELICSLSGEEQLILTMRFPLGPETVKTKIAEIGSVLGLSPKAVYNRLSRILDKCRKSLNEKGISQNELF